MLQMPFKELFQPLMSLENKRPTTAHKTTPNKKPSSENLHNKIKWNTRIFSFAFIFFSYKYGICLELINTTHHIQIPVQMNSEKLNLVQVTVQNSIYQGTNKYLQLEGCLSGSVSQGTRLVVSAQVMISVCEIEPRVGLCVEHRTCLGFSLSLSFSCTLMHAHGLSQKQIK